MLQVVFHVHRPLLANVAPPAPAAPAEEGEIEENGPAVPEGEHACAPLVDVCHVWAGGLLPTSETQAVSLSLHLATAHTSSTAALETKLGLRTEHTVPVKSRRLAPRQLPTPQH